MEWVENISELFGGCMWHELRDGEDCLARAWEHDSRGWWTIDGGAVLGTEATSLDDAKDAAWAAVYRSTR